MDNCPPYEYYTKILHIVPKPVSARSSVILRSPVVGHAMLSRHLILAGRGMLLGKEKKQTKKEKKVMMMMIVKNNY